MDIKTLAGTIHSTIEVDLDKEYSYDKLRDLFRNIPGHFSIVQDDTVIYTNLYEIIERVNINVKLTDLTIINHSYRQDDLNKIKYKYPEIIFGITLFRYKPKEFKDLTTEFELFKRNLDDDKLFMLYCVNLDGCMLSYASDNLKNDRELVYHAYKRKYSSFQYCSNEVKNDKEFIETKLFIPVIFEYLLNLKDDEEFVINVLKQSFSVIKDLKSTMINDKEFISKLFELDNFNCSIFQFFNFSLKNDKELIMKCIEVQKKNILKNVNYYTPRIDLDDIGALLRGDRDIIIECLKCDGTQLKNIPANYQSDNELILLGLNSGFKKIECWEEYEDILDYIDKSFRRDKTIVIAAIRRHGNNYHYASKRLKNDPEVIIEAINNCWYDISKDDKYQPYRNEICVAIRAVDNKIQKILESTNIRSEQISDAIINKLRKQYI